MTARKRERNPRCYFSLRSPYSWLAFRELVQEHPDVAARIEWVPFWEPDAEFAQELANDGVVLPYVAMSADKHRYILQDVRRLTRARGIAQVWPVDRDPWWEPSHLGWFVAHEAGLGRDYVELMYRMRWQEGVDISSPDVAAEAAAEAGRRLGLPDATVTRLRGAGTDPQLRAAGLETLRRIHRDGVFGVPMFFDGFDRYWGMERLRPFCDAVAVSTAPVAPDAIAPVPVLTGVAGDAGHAGGCG